MSGRSRPARPLNCPFLSKTEEQMRRFRSTVASLTSLALALQAPLAARAADTTSSDPVAQRCDRFAAPLLDTQYGGPREPITAANRDEALQVCRQAASAPSPSPRYTYLYGRVLFNAFQRYDEAVRQFTVARDAGNPWAALGLGVAYATGQGVTRTGSARCACTERPRPVG